MIPRTFVLALALMGAFPCLLAADEPPFAWRTWAERTDYRESADLERTMRYVEQLAGGSRWVRQEPFGTSGQGRALSLIIVSKDRAFTPAAARATGKPIVLVLNGIHAGEIEGKDASLALIRDLAVLGEHASVLDHVTLLVVPVFSVDAHERRSPYNRINQNGPDEMGWRFTPIGLNLNRDWMKAEAPEMKALLSQVFTRWWPDLLIDTHTTNGADYQHDVTYEYSRGPLVPRAIERWGEEAFERRAIGRLRAMGHLPAPYLEFKEASNPRSGVSSGAFAPRYSTTYAPLQCRPAILVETHMLKPYGSRVRATYDMLLATLEEVSENPAELLGAIREAEYEAASGAPRNIALTARITDRRDSIDYRGRAIEWKDSEIAGAPVAFFTPAVWDTVIPYWRTAEAELSVPRPAGYFAPREWTRVRELLDLHAVPYRLLAQDWSDTVEVRRIDGWRASPTSFEGHFPITPTQVTTLRMLRRYRAGDLFVPLDHRSALVAIQLLEAQAEDGLLYWNAFDTVLSPKEYAEAYVMEPIARKMLADDPALAAEFRARVAADSAFASSPAARLDFLYRRSKWADPEANLHPVARALRAPPAEVLAPKR